MFKPAPSRVGCSGQKVRKAFLEYGSLLFPFRSGEVISTNGLSAKIALILSRALPQQVSVLRYSSRIALGRGNIPGTVVVRSVRSTEPYPAFMRLCREKTCWGEQVVYPSSPQHKMGLARVVPFRQKDSSVSPRNFQRISDVNRNNEVCAASTGVVNRERVFQATNYLVNHIHPPQMPKRFKPLPSI